MSGYARTSGGGYSNGYVSGGSSFSPLDLNPVFWFDYNDYSVGTLSGESDKTGNYTVTSVNGITVASDGTNNALSADTADAEAATYGNDFATILENPYTMVFAYKPKTVSQTLQALCGNQSDASNSFGFFHFGQKLRLFYRINGNINKFDTNGTVFTNTDYKIIIFRVSQSSVKFNVNGVNLPLTATSFSDTLTDLDLSGTDMYVAARNVAGTGVASTIDGYIGDHILYDSFLTDAQVNDIVNYFV